MLGKLLKHEMKATMTLLLPLNLFIIILGFLTKFTAIRNFSYNVPEGTPRFIIGVLILIAYLLSIIIASCANILKLASRCYKNFFTDEGYLTFTLPVKPSTLFLVKVINSFIWYLFNILCVIASFLILLIGEGTLQDFIYGWNSMISELAEFTNIPLASIIPVLIIAFLVAYFTLILQIYASLSLGHIFPKHKIFASIVIFIATTIISGRIDALLQRLFQVQNYFSMFTIKGYYISIATSIVYMAVFYFISTYCMSKKLNLE